MLPILKHHFTTLGHGQNKINHFSVTHVPMWIYATFNVFLENQPSAVAKGFPFTTHFGQWIFLLFFIGWHLENFHKDLP